MAIDSPLGVEVFLYCFGCVFTKTWCIFGVFLVCFWCLVCVCV